MKFLIPLTLIFMMTQTVTAQKSTDEQAIRSQIQVMADGWTEGNGEKFASIFAEGHDYITWHGYYMKAASKEMNGAAHQGIFNSIYKDTELYLTVDKVRFLSKDLALVHVFGAVEKKGLGRPENPEVLITGILEKENGVWSVISFHNLDLEVFKDEQIKANAPMPAQVMYANWYAESAER